jgi:AcrR family transcriptional regulator
MGRPREHDEDTRKALLESAAHLMDTHGVSALSARRLADDAGVTTRAIYTLFGGMDGVFTELFRIGAEDMVARHEAVPRRADGAEEILPLALAYRAGARTRPEAYSLMYERCVPEFRPPDELVDLLWRCSARVENAVERGLASRGMRTRNAERITQGLWATVHGHASLELRGLLGPPRRAESVWRTTINAIVSATFPDR